MHAPPDRSRGQARRLRGLQPREDRRRRGARPHPRLHPDGLQLGPVRPREVGVGHRRRGPPRVADPRRRADGAGGCAAATAGAEF